MKHIGKRYVFFVVTFLIVSIIGTIFFAFNHKEETPQVNIQEILQTSSYSYLPEEAKEFVIDAYEETGEVVLTEANKEINQPYLNPKFVEYLSLAPEEQAEVDVIPNTYVIDYVDVEPEIDEAIPSSYDLRNVSGGKYITELKDQSTLGVCWAVSTTEIAESHLMVKNGTPGSTLNFSVRQLDYALSTNGISNGSNEFAIRSLGSGGNFLYSSYALANGVSLINDSYMPFSTDMSTKKYHEVFNTTRSLYELNSSIDIPVLNISSLDLSNSANVTKKNNYLNLIKQHIMSDGGAYVGSEGPGYTCSALYNGVAIIRVDDSCSQDKGHAMQVIGWDDNYAYKYCKNGSYHTTWTSSCSSANTVSGKGAWLLRNSWGNANSYVWLAYDSKDDAFSFITDMTSMSSKNWNHDYHTSLLYQDGFYVSSSSGLTFSRYTSLNETVKKVKFYAYSSNATYNVNICKNGTTDCVSAGSVTNTYPGYVTLDVSSKNISLTNDSFSISISSSNGQHIINSQAVFTSTTATTPVITTPNIESDNKYTFTFMSYTRNIPDNSTITYKLYKTDNTDVSSYITITNNVVALDKVFNYINISTSLPDGKYVLKATYGGYTYSSDFILYASGQLSGDGTSSNPYLINTIEQLKKVPSYSTAYFKLNADLDLSTFYGNFSTLQTFSGVFDGNGHTISGLTVPLFDKLSGISANTVTVKNLTLVNSVINTTSISGALANEIVDNGYAVSLSGINIIGGSVTTTSQAGVLIGRITTSGVNKTTINNVYSSAVVSGGVTAGLIGTLYSSDTTNTKAVKISNIQNVGINKTKVKSGYIIGATQNVIPNISNFIVTGSMGTDASDYHAVIGYVTSNALINSATIKDGYYSSGTAPFIDITSSYSSYTNNLQKKTPWNLIASSNISSWTNYSTYWETKTVDGVGRMVKLKSADITFTSFGSISVKEGKQVTLQNYITPNIEAAKNIDFQSKNTDICKIGATGLITAVKAGTCTIYVKSYYDGYEADVPVNVYGDNLVYVTYNNNGGTGVMTKGTLNKDSSYTISTNTFTKTGYTFSGWNTKSDGTGTSYSAGATISKVSSNITLYAQWTPITYTIKFSVDGNLTTVSSIVGTYDKDVTLPNNPITTTGYTANGWNTNENGNGTAYASGQTVKNLRSTSGTITLYAIKNPITYTVNYYFNNGTSNMVAKTYKYTDSFKMTGLYTPPTGSHIKSWNTKQDGTGTNYAINGTFSKLSTKDNGVVNLYAIVEKNTYTIKYNLNGVSGTVNDQTGTYDSNVVLRDNTNVKTGYTFVSWNTKQDGTGTKYVANQSVKNLTSTDGGVVTLYAIYNPITYHIKYYYQFNNLTAISDLTYDKVFTIPEPSYNRNLEFKGWNTKQDGTGTYYKPGASVSNLVSTSNQTFDLYAVWGTKSLFTVKNYTYTEQISSMEKVTNNTTYSKYASNITLTSGFTMASYRNGVVLGNNDIIGTGTKTKIMNGDSVVCTITNVVRGDVNGDGKITSADYISIRKHIMNTAKITDTYQSLGADVNQDEKISSADYIKIKKFIMNGGTF